MKSVRVDGLGEVQRALVDAQRDAVKEARQVVSKGCLNIKRDWQARWRGLTGLEDLPRTITYDVTTRGLTVRGEVGPDHRRGGQAPLAHIPEYGMPQQNTPPHPGGAPALAAEAPKFERYAADLGERLLS